MGLSMECVSAAFTFSRDLICTETNRVSWGWRSCHAHVLKDGRLCAAAFVQNRKSYTGCTDAPNPVGESGRPWCYVEAQVPAMHYSHVCCVLLRAVSGKLLDASATEAAWNYCTPVTDYDALRKEVTAVFADRAAQVQALVVKLQKTQRAAEQALDKHVPSHDAMRCRTVAR